MSLEWPLTPISRSRHFLKSNIVKRRVLKTKLLLHQRKLYLTYGMLLFGLDWPLNASRGFVSVSSASCYLRDAVSAVLATATCLAGWVSGWLCGWLSVTRRYYIKTVEPIWKLFLPSESPIILISWDPCADTQFHREPLQRGSLNTRGVWKIGDFRAIFDGYRRLFPIQWLVGKFWRGSQLRGFNKVEVAHFSPRYCAVKQSKAENGRRP